jgi:antitoxin component YwqK of YwqJK toxin-antitoxin module
VYREATFQNALPVGELRERDVDGELKSVASYVGGQQLLTKVTYFPESENKEVESVYLGATTIAVARDDYWKLSFAEYAVRGENQRHGPWKSWYSNGQLQSEGYYQYDRASGVFTWWHAHGQEAVKGRFADGQPDGTWTWWHSNGQKAAEGQYRLGSQVGTWRQWADDGRLVQRKISDQPSEPAAGPSQSPQLSQQDTPAFPRF